MTSIDSSGPMAERTSEETSADSVVELKKQKSQLEHDFFIVSKELGETNEKLKNMQQQYALVKEQVGSLEGEKTLKARFIESLVQSRDDLIVEKTQLQNDKLALERRKDEFELQISKMTNEKRRHLDEIDQLRKQYESIQCDKIVLHSQLDDHRAERAALAYEKDQWSREKDILLMSKQWYTNEIHNREEKINELRIENIREKAEMQRELTLLTEKCSELDYSNEQLRKSVEEQQNQFAELQDRFKKMIDENAIRVSELEAEVRTSERLANVYRDSSEAADKELAETRESEARLETLVRDREEVYQSLSDELKLLNENFEKAVKERDEEIKRLTEEMTKSQELLNAGFRMNRPDEEMVRLSPAAAVASSLLKSGMSLTAIYAEHCRVVSELEKKNDEFNQMEKYVTELIQDLDAKAPKFQEQRKAYDQMVERNDCLRLQNELLNNERQKLQSHADALARELTFTKRELERYQRDHTVLNVQVQRLLYVVEKGAEALDHHKMNGDSAADADNYLFSNIRELQTKNIELVEEVERLREEQQKIIENYHNSEIESLKLAYNQAKDELSLTKENYAKQELLIRELTEQRNQCKNMYDQLNARAGMSSNASTASEGTPALQSQPQTLSTLQADLVLWKTKAERLQETLAYLNEDRQTHEKILNDRIDNQLEQISSMRNTIGKLESDLEFQNKNQQLLAKQIDTYSLDLKRANEQLTEAKRQVETLQFKCDTLTSQMLEKQQELTTFRVQNHSLTEQLQFATSREQRMQAELEILRGNRHNAERLSSTLQEMESLLKRVEAEKAHSIESQLQSALLERDNLRQLVENLNEQHNQLVDGLKANLSTESSERNRAQNECKSIQSRLDAMERLYEQLKKDNERLLGEMEQIQSTDTNVEACKKEMQKMRNTITFHETQLADYKLKCELLQKEMERSDKKLEESHGLSTSLEDSIQFGTLQRQQLQSVKERLESELNASKETVEELRNNLAAKEMELLGQAKQLGDANMRLEEMGGKHEQQLMAAEKENHEARLMLEQLREANAKFVKDIENLNTKCAEMSEQNLRLTADLGTKSSDNEQLKGQIAEMKSKHESEGEMLQRSIDALQQEKMRQQDEINNLIGRDKENMEKQTLLYDEIQRLLKQIETMERLQNVITSPSPNTSLNASAMTSATFSPTYNRLSMSATEGQQQQQQHADRLNTIMGYMRTEKQKEMELRMNAELDLQRIRAQAGLDQQRIVQLETELTALRAEAEANAKAVVEKQELLTRLNALNDVQARYQQLKKASDDQTQQLLQLHERTEELEQTLIKAQSEKRSLEAKLVSTTKIANDRGQQLKQFRERCDRALALASKYSPEMVNSLQSDNEKLRSDVAQKGQDLELIKKGCDQLTGETAKLKNENAAFNEQLTALTQKCKEQEKNLQGARRFAIQFRNERDKLAEEKTKLEEELKSVQDELMRVKQAAAAGPSSTATPAIALAANKRIQALNEENAALKTKLANFSQLETERNQMRLEIEQMQHSMDEQAEKVMRIDMVEKTLRTCQQRLGENRTEIHKLREENAQLKQQIEELERHLAAAKAQQQQQAEIEDEAASHQQLGFNLADNCNAQQMPILELEPDLASQGSTNSQQQREFIVETPESPPPQNRSGASPVNEPTIEIEDPAAIIDELDKELLGQPAVEEGELGEGILDIDDGENAAALHVETQAAQSDQAQQHDQIPGDEQDLGLAIEEGEVEEEDNAALHFGDEVPYDGGMVQLMGGVQHGQQQQAEEEEYEDIGDEEEEEPQMTSDEDEMDDEEEEEEGDDRAGFYDGHDEEGDEEDEGGDDQLMESGEPPRKQRRMFSQQEEARGSNMDNAGDEDDDDDIQLL